MKIKHNAAHPLAEKVEAIIERIDRTRFDWAGGYPSDWMILGDLVIWANLSGGDWNEPELIVQEIQSFVDEWRGDEEDDEETP